MSDRASGLNAALSHRYRVERQLGEGGMATVYLANDVRHGRKVALKVLKPELAAVVGAERFLAEIRTTASLQHPHILPLFDSGQADDFLYYVMPYVEGESLRDRLDRERQLPVDEAVRIATNVAEALDYAHSRGVIHRDIKPANILLQAGKPVVSDFGIALAVSTGGGRRLTETGLSLGTPHYMSPEQSTGDQEVGPATDIWAVACVLYEVLAGEPPFVASTPQGVLGKIILGTATPIRQVRPSVPEHVDSVIRRALERVPADRFASAVAFVRALEDPGFRHGPATPSQGAAHSRRTVAGLATLSAALAAIAVWGWARPGTPTVPTVSRLTAMLPQDHRIHLPEWNVFPLALSADGHTLGYVGESDEGTALYVRDLDSYEAVRLEGTRGAGQPFFSPDAAWLGYFAQDRLLRVRVAGGAPIPVVQVPGIPAGGAWGPDGQIVFAADSALWRVNVDDGGLERVPWDAPGPVGWPSFLPEGSGGWDSPSVLVSAGAELFAVALDGGEAHALGVTIDGHGIYSGGFLVYSETSGIVRAVRFDPLTLQVSGTSVSVLEDVLRPNLTDATVSLVSASGTLAYLPGTSQRRLVLVDRAGRETTLAFQRGAYRNVAVSPDGDRVVIARRGEGGRILDLVRGTDSPSPAGGGVTWSPDGREVLGIRAGEFARALASPGAGVSEVYPAPSLMSGPTNWSQDGTVLSFTFDQRVPNRGGLFSQRLDGSPARVLLDTEADERLVDRSPDGRWITYVSDVSGIVEVYVRPFAGGESRQVSVNGGNRAVFSRDGRELFYQSGERMYSVLVDALDDEAPLEPELLFSGSYVLLGGSWDVRPQGDFVMVSAGPNWLREILVVQNWTAELEETIAPAGR